MRTPEEIKKGLICWKTDLKCSCSCPYFGVFSCTQEINGDALAYINELEERISLNTMRDAIYEDAVEHGLWDEEDDIYDCTSAIEVEFLELEHAADDVQYSRVCFDDDNEVLQFYVEELADVIIASLSVAGKLGIDIDAAVRRKMEINKARPWKHGKEEQ